MRTYKITLLVTLFSSIIILAVGTYLKFTNEETGGFTYSKTGISGTLSLNGNNIIFIGIAFLILSFLGLVTREKDKNKYWKFTNEDTTILKDLREKDRRERKRRAKKSRKNKQ